MFYYQEKECSAESFFIQRELRGSQEGKKDLQAAIGLGEGKG